MTKNIILFIHKEIRMDKFEKDASYKSNSDWNYQVIENLNAATKSQNTRDHVDYIEKSSKNIFEEISIEDNFEIFIKLFKKATEQLMIHKKHFNYLQTYLIHLLDRSFKEMNKGGEGAQENGLILFKCVHDLVVPNLTEKSNRKWQEEIFMREELYKTAFDIENLILSVFSNEYVKILGKFLRIMLRFSCLNFFSFYISIKKKTDLKNVLQSSFKEILNFQKVKWSSQQTFKIFNFNLPFIQIELEKFNQNLKETELLNLFKKNAEIYLKVKIF